MEIRNKSGSLLFRDGDPDHPSLHGIDLTDADLRGIDVSATILYGNIMRGADLRGANLYWSTIQNADLRDANLEGANVDGITLECCDLRGASLRGVSFAPASPSSQASFCGSNLSDADVAGARFDFAFFDDHTKFPEGFDPAERRMIHLRDWDAEAFRRDPESLVWGRKKEKGPGDG